MPGEQDDIVLSLMNDYGMSEELAKATMANLVQPNGARGAYPKAFAPRTIGNRTTGPVASSIISEPLSTEKIQGYLGQPAPTAPPAAVSMEERDERVKSVGQFFSPEAEARRKAVPTFWNSPTGKARLAEMEKRRAEIESRNADFAALAPRK